MAAALRVPSQLVILWPRPDRLARFSIHRCFEYKTRQARMDGQLPHLLARRAARRLASRT